MSRQISTRVPDELLAKMQKYQFLNWSGFIREAIEKQIEMFEKGEQRLLVA